jgi:hypothetical protein
MTRVPTFVALCCAIVLCTYSASVADDYTPSDLSAAQVLAKARAAYGTLVPGSYLVITQSHGGGIDDTYTEHIDGKDYLTLETSGAFVDSYGRFQGQSWSQDENGTVLLRSDFAAKTDPNTLALEHPDDPAYRVTVLGITTTDPRQYVIESNPPGGSDQYRYYDAKTMLLARVVTFAKDRHKHTTDYDDYRTAFGETLAYHTHFSDGRPDNDTDNHLDTFERDPMTNALPIPASRPLYTVPAGSPVTLPARFTRGGIVVRATINGRGLDFVLDSGSSSITLDPGVAHDLGLTPYGKRTQTVGGEVDVSRALVPQMQIGSLTLNNVTLKEIPLSYNDGDARVVGLLGCDFIAGAVIGIDFGKSTITVYPRDGFNPLAVGAVSSRPIQVDDCIPRIATTVESIPGWFLLDTGSFATVIYQNYLDKLPHVRQSDGQISSVQTVGGAISTRYENVSDLTFGPVAFKSASVVVPNVSIWDIRNYDGIFGRNAMQPFAIYLDYAGRVVYFKSEN